MEKEELANGVTKFTMKGTSLNDVVEIHSFPFLNDPRRLSYSFDITTKTEGAKDTTVFIDLSPREAEMLANYLLSHKKSVRRAPED